MKTALQPTGLMCDLLAHPERTLTLNRQPRFGWVVQDLESNAYQQAFRILVASDLDTLEDDEGDMWDSGIPDPGKVWESDPGSISVPYGGKPLESHSSYCWKVMTWNGVENPSPWSEPQVFHTGELTDEYTTPHYPPDSTEVAPVRVIRIERGRYFVDFGRAAFGTIRLTLDSPREACLEFHLAEVPDGPHGVNRNPGGSRRYTRIPLEIREGRHEYRLRIPADQRNTGPMAVPMPQDLFEVYPFRYCEIVGSPVPITSDTIRQVAVHYPFDDAAASFTSSNRVLNDVWELCRYTMKATSFCGLYVDGDRERIPYEADAYINQLGHYAVDREFTMARRTREYLLFHPSWPTEWHLYSVLMAWNDYLYSGDERSLTRYYPDLVAKTLTALAREDGLISTQEGKFTPEVAESLHFVGTSADFFKSGIRDIVDWPQVERDGYDMRPVNSVVNALHYRALICMAGIAETLGKPGDAGNFRRRAGLVKKTFQEKLIDRDTGLVLDGEGSSHSALHANAFALACDLLPQSMVEPVVDYLRSRGMACSVYASQLLLEALYAAGPHGGEYALALLTATGERSWAHMVYDVGTTIALEAWDDRLKPNQDWNHAWGAAPAGMISQGLMGIRPLKPGFEKILIRPQPGSLSWARIVSPTIRGPVRVELHQEAGRAIHLSVELPANVSAQVVLPVMGNPNPSITVDGRRIFGIRYGGGISVDCIGSGRHSFTRQAEHSGAK